MATWQSIKDFREARKIFSEIAANIQTGKLTLGRTNYAHSVTVAVFQSVLCNVPAISVIEFGIDQGAGLLDLCTAADYFRKELEFDVRVFGFDNATGLPAPEDFRDHPEMWTGGQFKLRDMEALQKKLPDFAKLVIGDVGDTVPGFRQQLAEAPLGFASVDVDFYSSTKRLMGLFKFDTACYLPAVPLYFDDIWNALSWNSWCGEELAIREFNDECQSRKIERKDSFKIRNFHVLHVLDHPLRTGAQRPRGQFPISVVPLF